MQPAVVVVDAGEKQNVFAPDIQSGVEELVGLLQAQSVSADSADNLYGTMAQEPRFSDAGDTELVFVPIDADDGEERAIDVELVFALVVGVDAQDSDGGVRPRPGNTMSAATWMVR